MAYSRLFPLALTVMLVLSLVEAKLHGHHHTKLHHRSKKHGPPALPNSSQPVASQVLEFSKRLYAEIGHGHNETVSPELASDFAELNSLTDGALGGTLTALLELRLLELQHSVRHAREILDIVSGLTQK
jgi:hypothetical protein